MKITQDNLKEKIQEQLGLLLDCGNNKELAEIHRIKLDGLLAVYSSGALLSEDELSASALLGNEHNSL